jgi:flagellar motor switch protein FliG
MKNGHQSNQRSFQLPAGRLISLGCAFLAGMALALAGRAQLSIFSTPTTSLHDERAVSEFEASRTEGARLLEFDTGTRTARRGGAAETVPLSNDPLRSGKGKESGIGEEIESISFHKLLETDIAHSLLSIQNIRAAKVLLALAEQRGNRTEGLEPSASVTITLDQPQALRPYQIKAIVHLVAASVPGLKAERVILVDQRGQLLNSKQAFRHSNWNAEQFEFKKNLEDQLKERAVNMLSPLVGAEALRVAVTADLNFTGIDSSLDNAEDNADADFPGAASQTSVESQDPSAQSGLIAMSSNTAAELDSVVAFKDARRSAGKNYPMHGMAEKSGLSESFMKPTLSRLSVVVLLDDNKTLSDAKQKKVRPFSQKDLDGFTRLVKQAVGFDSGRGDRLTLAHASFKKTLMEPSKKDLPYWQRSGFYPLVNRLIVGVTILLLFFGVARPFRRYWPGGIADGLSQAKYSKTREGAWPNYGGYDRSGFASGHLDEFQQALRALPNDVDVVLQLDPPADYLHRLEYIKKLTDADARLIAEIIILNLKKTDYDSAQLNKTALVMLSLGRDRAADVIRHLPPREMQKLGAAMASAKDVSTGAIDKAAEELIATVKSQNALVIDKEDYIRQVFALALGEDKAKGMVERVLPGTLTKGIEQFKWMDGRSVADLISNEHPQIIAIILSVLDSEQAAEVIMSMPEHLRSDLLTRIAMMKGVQPSALRELDQMIEHRLPENDIKNSTPIGGIDSAAGILNRIDSRIGDILLGEIADQNAELARNIQEKMLVFDDLIYLDAKGMQTVLREISTSQLLLALTDAGEGLKEKIFKSMSRRAAEMLREDLVMAPAADPSEVEFARTVIVKTVKKLADAGEIRLCINKELS